jgi:hypothetical protein
MPFWPSLKPCAKLTPVQVAISRPRIHDVGVNAVGDEQQPGGKDAEENDHRQGVETLVEVRPGSGLHRSIHRLIESKIGHATPLAKQQ